jgi:hypothetical protein
MMFAGFDLSREVVGGWADSVRQGIHTDAYLRDCNAPGQGLMVPLMEFQKRLLPMPGEAVEVLGDLDTSVWWSMTGPPTGAIVVLVVGDRRVWPVGRARGVRFRK